MKIIREYALSHLIENRRNSVFIFIAILVASSLICALGVYSHTEWLNKIDMTIASRGSWQGRFEEPIPQERLKYIQKNPQVKEVYLQSHAQTLKLSGASRSYISITPLSPNSWGTTIDLKLLLEGRLPAKSGEIVVSKLFFSENPQYKIGDTLLLPMGERVLEGNTIAVDSPRLEGETFLATGELTVTITGSLNVKGVSSYPCYDSYGFMDTQLLLPEGQYTVSASLKNIRKAYEVFPLLATNSGVNLNDEGQSVITYNTSLLELYGVRDPRGYGSNTGLSGYLLSVFLSIGLVMLLFIILIYNAFTVTAESQIKQLGILKSVGATPKQIRYCVLMEAFILASLAIPLGITLGYTSMLILIKFVMSQLKDNTDMHLQVVFSWEIILISILASVITVLLSAWGPAIKLGKLLPIEAVRNTPAAATPKKTRDHRWIRKWFGFEGELAINALYANKKAYRTTIISLTLCITLFLGFQSFSAIWIMDQKQMLAGRTYTLTISADILKDPDPLMLKELSGIPGIQKQVMYRDSYYSLLWDEERLSPDFRAVGGYKNHYFGRYNLEREGVRPRIFVELKGLDAASFAEYAKKAGADPAQFKIPAEHKGIVVNYTSGNINSIIDKLQAPLTEYLDIAVGDSLAVEERAQIDIHNLKGYTLKVGALTQQYPELDQYYYPFGLIVMVPMETYENIVLNLNPERGLDYQRITYKMYIPRENLAEAQDKANTILSQYLLKEDWNTRSLIDQESYYNKLMRSVAMLINGFSIFLGIVGITGAFTAVSGNLMARRRQFAVLRSSGLSPKGMNRILLLEGVFFGCIPLLLSVPLLIGGCSIMLQNASSVTWETLISNAPWGYVVFFLPFIVSCVGLAYWITGTRIKRESIIEAIRDEKL
ncbi:ABC transporter permease [Paenibacillus wynnii]|uniref:ABC3 transporter permease C-terminal domain-containing protein n=1 Tax=Paenibacillus wynnii TaxID=268407 RepID=A0A098M6N5_9BACL|nr:ABC transporter permease [Paenibacillus wynnii]KGE17693.1 hypothetical protein PWYN_24285 [Paenibacillus wynnii]